MHTYRVTIEVNTYPEDLDSQLDGVVEFLFHHAGDASVEGIKDLGAVVP